MRIRMLVLAVLLVCIADGEPGSLPTDPVRLDPIAAELPCGEVIGASSDVPRSYETILGAVALPAARSARRALPAYPDETSSPPGYFAKTGLVVRAGATFPMEVTQPRTATIGWGGPPDFGARVSTEGCEGDGWIVFPGASASSGRPASS